MNCFAIVAFSFELCAAAVSCSREALLQIAVLSFENQGMTHTHTHTCISCIYIYVHIRIIYIYIHVKFRFSQILGMLDPVMLGLEFASEIRWELFYTCKIETYTFIFYMNIKYVKEYGFIYLFVCQSTGIYLSLHAVDI